MADDMIMLFKTMVRLIPCKLRCIWRGPQQGIMTYGISEKDFTRFCLARFQDFKISPKISRFQTRFQDFVSDFKFRRRFLIGFQRRTRISDFKI